MVPGYAPPFKRLRARNFCNYKLRLTQHRLLRQHLTLRRNHARVETSQVKATMETRVLNLDALIHHHVQAGGLTDCGGLLAPGAQLHPDGLRS